MIFSVSIRFFVEYGAKVDNSTHKNSILTLFLSFRAVVSEKDDKFAREICIFH